MIAQSPPNASIWGNVPQSFWRTYNMQATAALSPIIFQAATAGSKLWITRIRVVLRTSTSGILLSLQDTAATTYWGPATYIQNIAGGTYTLIDDKQNFDPPIVLPNSLGGQIVFVGPASQEANLLISAIYMPNGWNPQKLTVTG